MRTQLLLIILTTTITNVTINSTLADSPAHELRAAWLTWQEYVGKSESQLRDTATNLRTGGINTVYISVYSNQRVQWPSKTYEAAGGYSYGSSMDRVDFALDIFHDEGLKVGAFFEYGMAVGYATHPIAQAHPDWLARNINGDALGDGDSLVFLSPAHMDAMTFVEDLLAELAENYDFDDIQLDRFRWSGRGFGYENACADLFTATYGYAPPSNQDESRWVRFRKLLVNEQVARCHDRIKSINPEICISSAPTAAYMMEGVLQDWVAWADEGNIDLAIAQMYFTNLSGFEWELNTHISLASDHLDKLAIGYWGTELDSYTLVTQQMNYARNRGIPHATLWVYHHYDSGAPVAIQDELDNLPLPGFPWEQQAINPFVSDRMIQIIIDNMDTSAGYSETGSWSWLFNDDDFRTNSRTTTGSASQAADFSASIPRDGLYDVFVWYVSDADRNESAIYTIDHRFGQTAIPVNQRTDGGKWVRLGSWFYGQDSQTSTRVRLDTSRAAPADITSADAVKLVWVGPSAGDFDDSGTVDLQDFQMLSACWTGPDSPLLTGCEIFDFDRDQDVDLRDFQGFQQVFGQP